VARFGRVGAFIAGSLAPTIRTTSAYRIVVERAPSDLIHY